MEPGATAHGGLAFVLRISRCLGCTPVRLVRTRNGYRVTLSYPLVYFGYACFVFFCSIFVSGLGIDLYLYLRRNIVMKISVTIILDILMSVLGSVFLYLNSKTRMKYMIEHLNIINQIRSKIIDDFHKWNPAEWKRIIIITTFFLEYIITNLTAIIRNVYLSDSSISFASMSFCTIICIYLIIFLMVVQLILMFYEVHGVFKVVKVKLVELLYQTNELHLSSETSMDLMRKSVRDFMNIYISAYNLVVQMIQRDGYILFFIITSLVSFIILDLWTIIDNLLTNNETNQYLIYFPFAWFFMNVIRIFYIIEPFHLITKESTEIQSLLTNVMHKLTPPGQLSSWEWDLIYKQLCLLDPTFQPLGMFNLHRSLIIKIVGFVTSYLVIIIQNAKKSTSHN